MNINSLIKTLIKTLSLGDITNKPIRIKEGLINKVYKVNTTTGIYAVKHLNPEIIKKYKIEEIS